MSLMVSEILASTVLESFSFKNFIIWSGSFIFVISAKYRYIRYIFFNPIEKGSRLSPGFLITLRRTFCKFFLSETISREFTISRVFSGRALGSKEINPFLPGSHNLKKQMYTSNNLSFGIPIFSALFIILKKVGIRQVYSTPKALCCVLHSSKIFSTMACSKATMTILPSS